MKKNKLVLRISSVFFIFFLIFSYLSLNPIISAQDLYLEAKFGMKKISQLGFLDYKGILAFVPISSRVNIAFASDKISDPNIYDLKSFSFSNKGKLHLLNNFADSTKGAPYKADAVWLGDFAYTAALADIPSGLVFVLFSDVPRSNRNKGGNITLAVARFDENGNRLSEWKDLFTAPILPNWRIDGESLRVAVGNGQVGVTFSLPFATNVPIRSRAVFLRTDFYGDLINKVVILNLPNNGNNHYTKVFRPLWNGTCWLVPAVTNIFQRDPRFNIKRRQLLIFASTDSEARKFKRKKITQDNQGSFFDSLSLVLGPSGSGQEDTSLLFVQRGTDIPWDKREMESKIYNYFLFSLNKWGKKIGSPIEVLIPKLEYSFEYDPTYPTILQENIFSNMLTSYHNHSITDNNQNNDDVLYIVQAHTLWNRRSHAQKCEQQVNFYKIYPEDGSVAHLVKNLKKRTFFRMTDPLIATNGKLIKAVTNTFYSHAPGGWDSYISIINK